jgi:CheY-like chemotaxis protein
MILCVDDEQMGLSVRKRLLESQGYKVLTASSGRDALEVFADNPVEAVVVDYDMPGMDGCQVAAELKRRNPAVKILLLSAYLDLPESALQWVDGRAVKGASTKAFLAALHQLLDS